MIKNTIKTFFMNHLLFRLISVSVYGVIFIILKYSFKFFDYLFTNEISILIVIAFMIMELHYDLIVLIRERNKIDFYKKLDKKLDSIKNGELDFYQYSNHIKEKIKNS